MKIEIDAISVDWTPYEDCDLQYGAGFYEVNIMLGKHEHYAYELVPWIGEFDNARTFLGACMTAISAQAWLVRYLASKATVVVLCGVCGTKCDLAPPQPGDPANKHPWDVFGGAYCPTCLAAYDYDGDHHPSMDYLKLHGVGRPGSVAVDSNPDSCQE